MINAIGFDLKTFLCVLFKLQEEDIVGSNKEVNTMKKTLSLLLVLTLLMSTSTVALAITSQAPPSVDGLYIASEEVPKEVYIHIQESIAGIICDLYDTNNISVSEPFKLFNTTFDLYYSLIYSDGKIVATYRSYEIEGRYTGILSENTEIIEGFEKISFLTSIETPAKIISGEYDDLYALIGADIYPIFSDPSGKETESKTILDNLTTRTLTHVIDLTNGIMIEQPYYRSNPTSRFLQIGWDETQGSQPWCMAYVTASIMRYKTGNNINTISAQSVMQWAYPNYSQSQLNEESLSTTQADAFANTYNIDPRYTSSRRTYSQIVNEILAYNPVAFICDNLNTGTKKSHALVCRGYNDNNGNSFYSVWNPWYKKFERIYTSDNTYVNASGTARYLWSATMYDWD